MQPMNSSSTVTSIRRSLLPFIGFPRHFAPLRLARDGAEAPARGVAGVVPVRVPVRVPVHLGALGGRRPARDPSRRLAGGAPGRAPRGGGGGGRASPRRGGSRGLVPRLGSARPRSPRALAHARGGARLVPRRERRGPAFAPRAPLLRRRLRARRAPVFPLRRGRAPRGGVRQAARAAPVPSLRPRGPPRARLRPRPLLQLPEAGAQEQGLPRAERRGAKRTGGEVSEVRRVGPRRLAVSRGVLRRERPRPRRVLRVRRARTLMLRPAGHHPRGGGEGWLRRRMAPSESSSELLSLRRRGPRGFGVRASANASRRRRRSTARRRRRRGGAERLGGSNRGGRAELRVF